MLLHQTNLEKFKASSENRLKLSYTIVPVQLKHKPKALNLHDPSYNEVNISLI